MSGAKTKGRKVRRGSFHHEGAKFTKGRKTKAFTPNFVLLWLQICAVRAKFPSHDYRIRSFSRQDAKTLSSEELFCSFAPLRLCAFARGIPSSVAVLPCCELISVSARKTPTAAHESSSSRSSCVKLCSKLLSALMIASARSRLDCCSSNTFSSTVSRAITR